MVFRFLRIVLYYQIKTLTGFDVDEIQTQVSNWFSFKPKNKILTKIYMSTYLETGGTHDSFKKKTINFPKSID